MPSGRVGELFRNARLPSSRIFFITPFDRVRAVSFHQRDDAIPGGDVAGELRAEVSATAEGELAINP
jgi:hypothetical protein